jgi:hypothetical protein
MRWAGQVAGVGEKRNLCKFVLFILGSGMTRVGWGFKPPPPKFRSFAKAEPNSKFR